MPHIVETACTRLNITADGVQGILIKINASQSILRAAGITTLPDMCLCPAIKLIQNVRMLEKHELSIPDEITTTTPAKSLIDLPNELLGAIFDDVFEEIMKNMAKNDWHGQDEDEILFTSAFRTLRLLVAAQRVLGMNSLLRAIVLERFLSQLQEMPVDWQSLANVLGYGRTFYTNYFMMSGVELCLSLYNLQHNFCLNKRLYNHALCHFLDNITLSISFQTIGFEIPQPDFFLSTDGLNIRLHAVYDQGWDIQYSSQDLLPYLPLIKKALVLAAVIDGSRKEGEEKPLTPSIDFDVDVEQVIDFTLLGTALPALESLTVCVGVNRFGQGAHARRLMSKAIESLRSLPIERKIIFVSPTCYLNWEVPQISWDFQKQRECRATRSLMICCP